jgi:hypothetical protein
VKTAQNSQRSKASNAVLASYSRAVRGVISFRVLEACNLVTATFKHESLLEYILTPCNETTLITKDIRGVP